jgi:diguanylate cyclase (GGDEF)-like protein
MDNGADTLPPALTGQESPDPAGPAGLAARIDTLLSRRMTAGLPRDIEDMYRNAMRRTGRRNTFGFFMIVAVFNFLNVGFDFFMLPPPVLVIGISNRLLISVIFVAAAWLFRRDRMIRFEPFIAIIPCLVTISLAGTTSLLSGDPVLLERYMTNCMVMVMGGTFFLFIDTIYACWLGGLALLILSGLIIASDISLIAVKAQIIFFYAGAEGAILWGRYVLNLYRARLFLLNTRDDLRNAAAMRDNAILSRDAFTDPLTNAANRRAFNEAVRGLMDPRRHLRAVSLCMIDIDHFKVLNDTDGHMQGDLALRAVANTITSKMRGKSDLLARFGGDEFVLLLPGSGTAKALELAERIRAAIETVELQTRITVSIGVAAVMGRQMTVEALLLEADAALYRAKAGGRNRVSL